MTQAVPRKPYAKLYWAAVVLVVLFACIAPAAVGADNPRILYACSLFAICASPLLFVEHFNGRYALLCILLPIYFVVYGAADLLAMVQPPEIGQPSQGVLTTTEVSILLGAVMLLLGYRLASWLTPKHEPAQIEDARDWPMATIVVIGLLLWAVGLIAKWTWNVNYQRTSVELVTDASGLTLAATMLGQMVGPIGVLVLAYGLAVTRSRQLQLLMIVIALVGLVVGFFGDSKELGMLNILLVVLAIFLVDGRLAKGWLAMLALFMVFAFPLYAGYRAEIIGAGKSRADGAANAMDTFQKALAGRKKISSGEERAPNFLERATLKGNQELVITHVGKDVPYQAGGTLVPLLTALIPRLILPNKPDSSAGQFFNQAFHVSADERTYISPTFLGELYWNFGWLGILLGMPLIGFHLGFVNARCSFRERPSVTRLLVLASTAYSCCARLEGNIALQYTLWLRAMVVIAILHFIFARSSRLLPRLNVSSPTVADSPPAIPQRRFVNLLD